MVDATAILIEDNRAVADTLRAALEKSYHLMSTAMGKEGLSLIKTESPEIIILDLNLPDMPGIKICQETRKIGVKAPILVLSGDSRLSTKLELFSAGADDYLVKPFSLGELQARLKAMSWRMDTYRQLIVNPSTPSLTLDRVTQSVVREGSRPIRLRQKEYAVLECLMKSAGETLSRQKIADYAWNHGSRPWTNTVDVHINHLREKVDKPFGVPLITTIHGVGYRVEVL